MMRQGGFRLCLLGVACSFAQGLVSDARLESRILQPLSRSAAQPLSPPLSFGLRAERLSAERQYAKRERAERLGLGVERLNLRGGFGGGQGWDFGVLNLVLNAVSLAMGAEHSEGHGTHGHSHEHSHSAHSHGHSHSAHSHGHSHSPGFSPVPGPLSELYATLQTCIDLHPKSFAIAASVLVSCSSLFVMPFMKLLNQGDKGVIDINDSLLLKVLVSFAVGAMLGDVFLHMLPHAIHKPSSHENMVDQALGFGLPILYGMIIFYVAEKGIGAVTGAGGHSHDHHHDLHACGQKHEAGSVEAEVPCAKSPGGKHIVRVQSGCIHTCEEQKKGPFAKLNKFRKQTFEVICRRCDSLINIASTGTSQTKPAAMLNLLADMLHNFSDGLALGVAYGKGHGIVTTLAVFFHEVPHNIADFAILIQHGFSQGTALKAQFASAVGALIGCIVGLYIRDFRGMEGFIAGGFIYIATVDIVPLMLQDTNLRTMFFEVLAMTLGVTMNIMMLHLESSVPEACIH